MSIQIEGRRPSAPAGRRFQPEFWAWRPIHALIGTLCGDLFDERTLSEMEFNKGGGPMDQATCTEMANRFEGWMKQHGEGFGIESGIRVTEDGRFVSEQELAEHPAMETVSAYEVSHEQLQKWLTFLRSCGGFEVW